MTTGYLAPMRAADYHADPADVPSLSRSIAHLLCTATPRHAWAAHPKLNPFYAPRETAAFDLGTVAHALLLEGNDVAVAVPFADWRTNDAKAARDEVRAAGRIPLLETHAAEVASMVDAAREQIANHHADPPLLADGRAEIGAVWTDDGGVTCRALIDWLRDDLAAIDDYKTTSRLATRDQWSRSLFGYGYDVQAAFYIRAVEQLTGVAPRFRWIVQETAPPFLLSVIEPGADVLSIGRKKVDYAIRVWRECLDSGVWPAYPDEVEIVTLPPWEEDRWLAREERDLLDRAGRPS